MFCFANTSLIFSQMSLLLVGSNSNLYGRWMPRDVNSSFGSMCVFCVQCVMISARGIQSWDNMCFHWGFWLLYHTWQMNTNYNIIKTLCSASQCKIIDMIYKIINMPWVYEIKLNVGKIKWYQMYQKRDMQELEWLEKRLSRVGIWTD